MLVTDTLASYGNMKRYKNVRRISKVGDNTIIAASGEYSDFQFLLKQLDTLEREDWANEDGCRLNPSEYASYICRTLYQRRSKLNPLWNSYVIAGYKDNKPYLGYADLYGTAFEETAVGTGLGAYFAIPLLREKAKVDMTEAEARKLLEDCMRILFYRDTNAFNRIQFASATAEGLRIEDPIVLETKWDFEAFLRPTISMGYVGNSW